MLTDEQFAATQPPDSIVNYQTFGFTSSTPGLAIGMIEHTRLGATHYFIQRGPLTNRKWHQVERDEYYAHLTAFGG